LDDEGFPNGGIWRFSPSDGAGRDLMIKRTGPEFLGGSHVWSLSAEPASPRWWGRESAFYSSDLARTGWPDGCRVPRSWIDDHDGQRDIWLEAVEGLPSSVEVCERAVRGLAYWQLAHRDEDPDWSATDWIAEHVGRYHLDNQRTLAHSAWPCVLERGLDPMLREFVGQRATKPADVRRRLAAFPQLLTHHDFHNNNLGTVDADVVIFDWAYVGPGPIGHDVGHLAVTMEPMGVHDPAVTWQRLVSAYCQALIDAGWDGSLDLVRRSIAVSTQLRLGWMIDELLDHAGQLNDGQLTVASSTMTALVRATG